jgi:N-acetylglucosaminyl-diphospho-decaprenol L-rhamnosyltransferase
VIGVAIIIVTFKSARLTIDCLHSIATERAACDLNILVTVVDNSHVDFPFIEEEIRSQNWASWITLVCPPKNGGFAYGNNFGARIACSNQSPEYIYLLNPDTVIRKGAISALVNFLEIRPEVGIAGSGLENPDGTDWPFAFRFPTIVSEIEEGLGLGLATLLLSRWVVARTMANSQQQIDWVPGASMMIRRSTFEALCGLDEEYFLYFEETDLCYRARERGFQTWYVPDSRVMHVAGQSTKVTERDSKPQRLPSYWFESRRRFFTQSYGRIYAAVTDIAALTARSLGKVKHMLAGQRDREIPFFISDLIRHAAFWPQNFQSRR